MSQELEKLKAKWQEMEEEAKTLRELGEKQEADDKLAGESTTPLLHGARCCLGHRNCRPMARQPREHALD